MATILPVLAGMSLLQELELEPLDAIAVPGYVLDTTQLRQILATSSQLRSLTVACRFGQEQFDVLLTQGTQLMSVTIDSLHRAQDRSQSACSWKELTIREQQLSLHMLALVPLHSLEHLHIVNSDGMGLCLPTQRPSLDLPLGINQQHMLPQAALLQRILANLERCPAWQQSGPCVELGLGTACNQVTRYAQVFAALPALASKSLHLVLHAPQLLMNKAAVQELSTAVGAHLTGLSLAACKPSANFWPAMWAHLPALQQLSLGEDVSARLTGIQ
jgi:hypothetical protein